MPEDDETLPWHLGVYDAHCHPTDTLASLADIPTMKTRVLTVMATRSQDQELVADAAQQSVDLLGSHSSILPSFGWHPWFSHHLFDPAVFPSSERLSDEDKARHYRSVLEPNPDDAFISSLPDPIAMTSHISTCREKLLSYPPALVGEIGLDRAFRLPAPWTDGAESGRDPGLTPGGREGRRLSPYRVKMEHQRFVLQSQLRLAGELGRAVSVHGVQCHGLLYDALAACWSKGPFPKRICLHSYSGPAEGAKRYLQKSVPARVYFSFSVAVNWSPTAGRTEEVVRAVPADRILVESDLHVAGQRMDEMMEEVVRRVCSLKGWGPEQGVKQLGQNYKDFIMGT